MGNIRSENQQVTDDTRRLMADALVWDDHLCMPLRPDDESFLPQLQRVHDSGVDVVSLNVCFDAIPWENGIKLLSTFRRWLKQRADKYVLVEKIADIERAHVEKKLAVTFDLEGGLALDGHLPMIELYYDLGVRWMLFAYNLNNELGGGCNDKPVGLTDFGRQVLREMERVGMGVCCSHTAHETVMDIMEMAEKPVIFSHSNPAGLFEHYRNVKDEAIVACAKSGGLIAINGIGMFLGDNNASTEAMVRHIDYLVQLVGHEHVGLGTDYVFDQSELEQLLAKNPTLFDAEMNKGKFASAVPEQIPEITEHLLRMNYPEQAVRNILGENHLRVAKAVWR